MVKTSRMNKTNQSISPSVPSPGSPQPWHHEQCSELQSFHSYGYRRTSQCSGLKGQKLFPEYALKCSGKVKSSSMFSKCINNSRLPLEKTGVWPVSCSSTLAARVSLSPLSPTQMFRHSLRMRNSLMGFSFFSPWSCK